MYRLASSRPFLKQKIGFLSTAVSTLPSSEDVPSLYDVACCISRHAYSVNSHVYVIHSLCILGKKDIA
jgi:hypothetical protein